MVLWEITVATAYFLGLKRTYRLALTIQRRVVSSKHPRIRQFLQRRTRAVFDVALKVHKNIQERDIRVGRNVGNWMLRWLDRMKPSAQIRAPSISNPTNAARSNMNMTRQVNNSSNQRTPAGTHTSSERESGRHLFTSSRNVWSKSFPTIAMMMQPPKPTGTFTQYRQLCMWAPEMSRPTYRTGVNGFEGVIRKDIMQFLLQH